MNFEITRNARNLTYKSFVFPGGEIGVKLDIKNNTAFVAKTGFFAPAPFQTITARLKSANDIIELTMIVDALRNIDNTPIKLIMPYVPYGRQDRVCDNGESFSLKVFANIINSLNFYEVIVLDPHSNVTGALFNNIKVISQLDIINKWTKFIARISSKTKFISPDSGANKKTADIAGFFSHNDFVRADKLRDLSNGNIKETIVYCEDFKGQDVVCCDDICDGGRTFTELAKVCKAKNCGKFVLFVTHGIFSKGIETLLENGIDEVWFTNSFNERYGFCEADIKTGFTECYRDGCGIGFFDLKAIL